MTNSVEILTRRAILQTAAAAASVSATAPPSKAATVSGPNAVPKGFLWGAATAGHQVEGNNVNSDMWQIEHVTPTLFKESSGDACDSLHRWSTDLDLLGNIGLNTYRFSLEWARIEPAPGEFSVAMLDYYRSIIAACHERGILPMVTFNHYTAPRWFAARGGWETAGAADLYARFAERAARHLGDLLVYATTLNEPNILYILKWLPLPFPPSFAATQDAMLSAAARACGSTRFSVANFGAAEPKLQQMIEGHKKGYAAIKNVRPAIQAGVSLSITDDQAVGPNSKRDEKRQGVYGAWMDAAKTVDFIGVQNYGRQRLDDKGIMAVPEGAELTQMGEEFYPASLEGAVRYAHEATGLPVMVTENGIATVNDQRRAAYIPLAVAGLHRAIAGGVPVKGYVHWSLVDNFEWLWGFTPRYGLSSINRQSFQRTVKPSALVLGRIAANNAV